MSPFRDRYCEAQAQLRKHGRGGLLRINLLASLAFLSMPYEQLYPEACKCEQRRTLSESGPLSAGHYVSCSQGGRHAEHLKAAGQRNSQPRVAHLWLHLQQLHAAAMARQTTKHAVLREAKGITWAGLLRMACIRVAKLLDVNSSNSSTTFSWTSVLRNVSS